MENKENLSLEQRIFACKKAHPEWLVYKPELMEKGAAAVPESPKALKLEKMHALRNNWRRGLMVQNKGGTILAVQENGTVALFPPSKIQEVDDRARWLLQQKNVRKIICEGRFSAVLYKDGTVDAYVMYVPGWDRMFPDEVQDAEFIPVVRKWTNIVDIMSSATGLTALDKNGRLHAVSYTNKAARKEPFLQWAAAAENVMRMDIGEGVVPYYQDKNGNIHASEQGWGAVERTAGWEKNMDIYAFARFFSAGISKSGKVICTYNIDRKEYAEVEKWPEIADILADAEILIGITTQGDVRAVGTVPQKYDGLKNVAFMTKVDSEWIGVTWDGTCVTHNKKVDFSGVKFSWLLK